MVWKWRNSDESRPKNHTRFDSLVNFQCVAITSAGSVIVHWISALSSDAHEIFRDLIATLVNCKHRVWHDCGSQRMGKNVRFSPFPLRVFFFMRFRNDRLYIKCQFAAHCLLNRLLACSFLALFLCVFLSFFELFYTVSLLFAPSFVERRALTFFCLFLSWQFVFSINLDRFFFRRFRVTVWPQYTYAEKQYHAFVFVLAALAVAVDLVLSCNKCTAFRIVVLAAVIEGGKWCFFVFRLSAAAGQREREIGLQLG